jgi:hypothetical protein
LENYEPHQDFELSYEPFKLAFQRMPNLSASGRFGIMFEHFRNYFHLEDSVNGFPQLFQLYFKSHKVTLPSNCTYPWGNLPLRHDQTFWWSSSHCWKGNTISIHKSRFMFSILWHLCNTFFPSPIRSSNQGRIWNSNPWHEMHLGPSTRLGCYPTKCFECLQFSVKYFKNFV